MQVINQLLFCIVDLYYPIGRASTDWLKTFECDVMIGYFYTVVPTHFVTTQLRIQNTVQHFEHVEQQIRTAASSLVCNGFMLGQRSFRLNCDIFTLLKNEKPSPCPGHKVINYVITVSFEEYQKYQPSASAQNLVSLVLYRG